MTQPELPVEALPSGSRIIHIGPSKTGTTSVQAALWEGRSRLDAQAVHYAGTRRHSASAARAGARVGDVYDSQPPAADLWQGVVREIRRSNVDRVVLSSEWLAHAAEPAIESIVKDVGADRIQVVVTLRPIAKMLSSLWQQKIQIGGRRSFTEWLDEQLGREGDTPDQSLWNRHRHDRLVDRWGGIVGMDRVTVVVVDSSDHHRILRDFESLLGVSRGTLHLVEEFDNRSLTLPEARALLDLNRELFAAGAGRVDHMLIVREGAARLLKLRTPGADEARIRLPEWAGNRAAEIAAAVTEGIAASGVRVIGDLGTLTQLPELVAVEDPDDGLVVQGIATSMAIGAAYGAGRLRDSRLVREHPRLAEAGTFRRIAGRDTRRVKQRRFGRLGSWMGRLRLGG